MIQCAIDGKIQHEEGGVSLAKTVRRITPPNAPVIKRKRVAAYARVSSGKDAMLKSLSAQISYYSSLIQNHPEWQFVRVYADEALSGTKDTRPELNRLLEDCRAGKVDMIITKSISRFARNTVTLLSIVRELKAKGITVWFEKENLYSDSGEGEMVLTLLASVAQEESRAVSENCKWRIRSKMKRGELHSINLYGYRLVDGQLHIVPEEASVVQMIFADYLSGMGLQAISNKLEGMRVPTRSGGDWHLNTISNMLSCEKYIGDLLLQKTFIENHINKRKRYNKGELAMYLVECSHEPIIDRETFAAVQIEKATREINKGQLQRRYDFSGKLVCGICGKHYRRKISNAGSRYEKPVWICKTFNSKGKKHCPSQQIPENILIDLVGDVPFKEIHIPKENTLVLIEPDGNKITKQWENPSRRDSWTEEKKAQAAERQREYELRSKGYVYS